jgi:hypothetical protein
MSDVLGIGVMIAICNVLYNITLWREGQGVYSLHRQQIGSYFLFQMLTLY